MQIRLKPTDEVITSEDALQWIIDHIDPEAVEIIADKSECIEILKNDLKAVDEPLEVYELVPEPVEAVEPEETAKAETSEERRERFEAILDSAGAREPMPRHTRRQLDERVEQKPRRIDYDL